LSEVISKLTTTNKAPLALNSKRIGLYLFAAALYVVIALKDFRNVITNFNKILHKIDSNYKDIDQASAYMNVMYKFWTGDKDAFPKNMTGYTKGTKSQYVAMGWGYPLSSGYKEVSSPYGYREKATPHWHMGIDLPNAGDEIVAVTNGKVVYVNKTDSGEGYCIAYETDQLDPVSGEFVRVIVMHMQDKPDWKINDPLEKGQTIGYVGSTGNSGGPHLHFEVYNNTTDVPGSTEAGLKHRINPVWFYPGISFTLQPCSSPNGLYWDIDDKYMK
jgi:murein DD-endopeptidase MepM/ murein hydrolase activator NlpD